MKNITLSADEDLIERGRAIARERRTTMNGLFREWLAQLTASTGETRESDSLMRRLRYVNAGRHYSRDEMNER
jgi:predicted transcriptional regulator